MASELRVNTINSRTGFGTITVSETGQDLVGITTIENLTTENTLVGAAASFTGNVQIGGVLTYEDVTNIDSVGLITAREGVFIPDSKELKLGNTAASPDLKIYHSGTHSFIKDAGTGNLQMWTNQLSLLNSGGTESMIQAIENGAVQLYYDNSNKFETNANGVEFNGNTYMNDAGKSYWGTGNDLQIYHSGSDSFIDENGSGDLKIRTVNGNGIQLISGSSENMITCATDGAVKLYYDNTMRIDTTSYGARCTGNLVSTGNIKAETDNAEIICGAGEDLKLYSSGTMGHIKAPNDDLRIQAPRVTISNVAANETMIDAYQDGAVQLYHNNIKRLETTANGVQTYFNAPYVVLGLSGTMSISTANGTKVDWSAEIIDRGNNFDTSNERFTAPVTGDYLFSLSIQYTGQVNQLHTGIYFNGGSFNSHFDPWVNHGDDIRAADTTFTLYLSTNDYVEFYTYHSTGSTQQLETNRTKATIRFLG